MPETVPEFSATAYFFGRYLHNNLRVPVGIIHSSWGGTIIEAWTSGDALKSIDELKPEVESIEQVAESRVTLEKLQENYLQEKNKKVLNHAYL